jgi:hypothetical protein
MDVHSEKLIWIDIDTAKMISIAIQPHTNLDIYRAAWVRTIPVGRAHEY